MTEVLLSTYNGERFLEQQLESLLNQDYEDFIIRIRDDCSTDRTDSIINHYVKRYGKKIIYKRAEKNSGSAGAGFFELIKSCKGEYALFCDQDDVWHRDKISLTMAEMKKAEETYGRSMPIMVHTDLRVVNESLEEISPSMFKRQHLKSDNTAVNSLLVQNIATGCTMAVNRALLDNLKYSPEGVPVHDWWIALLTASIGKIVFLDKATIDYRQHNSNSCGAKDMSSPRYILSRLRGGKKSRLMIKYGYRQAEEMARFYGNRLGSARELIRGYGELEGKPYIDRLKFVVKNRVYKSGIIRKLGQFLFL